MTVRLAEGGRSLYRIAAALLPGLFALAAPAPAAAAEALAREHNCMNCHAIDRKKVGPGIKQVAQRYAEHKDAAPKLADKIVNGGAGAWGAVAMPSNPVSKQEALQLAPWVLATK
jgi:cytochrome c